MSVPFARSAIKKAARKHDRSLKLRPPRSPSPPLHSNVSPTMFPSRRDELWTPGRCSALFQNNGGEDCLAPAYFSGYCLFSILFLPLFFLASLPPPLLFRSVILYGVVYSPQPNPPPQPPAVSLKKNNEDLQNAKKHAAVPLIAAEGYQSLKQMAYRLRGFVLDMPTTRRRGDLWKIMRAEDYGVRLIYFTNHFSFKKKKEGKIQIKLRSFDHCDNDCFCNYHCSVGFLFFFFPFSSSSIFLEAHESLDGM